ncbi:two-component system regulatory protein YycI [Pontibacillus sp. ALD_SL1]|uniref:two-component system regulatory protein YycI n=1 Tax=Pontibacillus sp. ALD_SL1 TaxID=2777185 RepID=UPI001A96DB58|nr:two-component system regulatory protein YycI [Pontibacillus sp. ALD_SL1]QST00045.1 two-component system regulatory protein YycI [Pontibacillus sp. ALD_SL1]
MQWGQIKTLFILCFLILDVFLVYQFINKTEQAQLVLLPDTSIEEQLEAEDIQLQNLPNDTPKKTRIYADRYDFKEEDQEKLAERENQKSSIGENGKILTSVFNEPVEIDLESDNSKISSIVKEEIIFGDEYEYWGYNEKWNVLIFFQLHEDNPIYFNESGVVLLSLNEEKTGLIGYLQTRLVDVKSTGKEQDLIKPIQAISTLFDKNQIYSRDTVTEFDIGYYTLVPLQEGGNGVQFFSPTWNIHVNEERNYFVNGLDGQYIAKEEDEFLERMNKKKTELEQPIRGGES